MLATSFERLLRLLLLDEVRRDRPELYNIHLRLRRGEELRDEDKAWIREVAEATGWDDDIINELRDLDATSEEQVEKYLQLALEHCKRGDTRQAGEKLWGAATALIKLYAALKCVPAIHGSISKLDHFITRNVDEKYRKLSRGLPDKAHILHEHFYEGHIPREF